MISEDEFTPKTAISGFATIKKGITLTTAISDTKLQGTATDSDALGGVAAANYLRSNANDTTSGTLGIVTDSGMTLGADNDLSLTIDATGVVVSNTTPPESTVIDKSLSAPNVIPESLIIPIVPDVVSFSFDLK